MIVKNALAAEEELRGFKSYSNFSAPSQGPKKFRAPKHGRSDGRAVGYESGGPGSSPRSGSYETASIKTNIASSHDDK